MVSLELLDDVCVGGVPLDGVDALQGAGLGLVALADGDDLPVAGLEPEHGPAGLVDMDLVFRNLLGLVALDLLDRMVPGIESPMTARKNGFVPTPG